MGRPDIYRGILSSYEKWAGLRVSTYHALASVLSYLRAGLMGNSSLYLSKTRMTIFKVVLFVQFIVYFQFIVGFVFIPVLTSSALHLQENTYSICQIHDFKQFSVFKRIQPDPLFCLDSFGYCLMYFTTSSFFLNLSGLVKQL